MTIEPSQEEELTYLKLTQCKLGLLVNFNVAQIKSGIKRVVLSTI
jgi:hypothetical protein